VHSLRRGPPSPSASSAGTGSPAIFGVGACSGYASSIDQRSSKAIGGWHMRCDGREHGDNLTSPMEFQNELIFISYKAFASGSSRGCLGPHCRDARLRSPRRRGGCVRARRRRSRRRFARAHRRLRSPDRTLSLWGARVPIRTRLPGLACGPWLLGRAPGLGLAGGPRLRWGPRIRWGSRLRWRWPRGLRWRRPRGSGR
jgi:hypothetical protein